MEDLITFFKNNKTPEKYLKGLYKDIDNLSNGELGYINVNKNMFKFGKYFNNINNSKLRVRTIEKYTNLYKAYQMKCKYKFEVYSSKKDILKSFDSDNLPYHNSPLSNSCMNDKFKLVKFYYKNNIEVLVLKDSNGGIVGRSLLFNNLLEHNKGIKFDTYAERVYYSEDFILDIFIDKFIESGYGYNYNNDYEDKGVVGYNGKSEVTELRYPIIDKSKNKVPYLDTFSYSGKNMKYIRNHNIGSKKWYIYDSIDGNLSISNGKYEMYIEDNILYIDMKFCYKKVIKIPKMFSKKISEVMLDNIGEENHIEIKISRKNLKSRVSIIDSEYCGYKLV